MQAHDDNPEQELAELARLADGSLPPERRRAVEEQVAASPELARRLQEQHNVRATIRAVAGPAPHALRRRVLGEARRRPAVTRRRALSGALAAAAAAATAVVVLVPGGGAAHPTVAQAAALAARPATGPAPGQRRGRPRQLAAHVDGVPYPYFHDAFGWQAVGARRDELTGRAVTTVFYSRDGLRVGYSIVPGAAIAAPSDARAIARSGVTYHLFSSGGRSAVTWVQHGHTCVLSGPRVGSSSLLRLAAWRA